jgi:hypothetical protein
VSLKRQLTPETTHGSQPHWPSSSARPESVRVTRAARPSAGSPTRVTRSGRTSRRTGAVIAGWPIPVVAASVLPQALFYPIEGAQHHGGGQAQSCAHRLVPRQENCRLLKPLGDIPRPTLRDECFAPDRYDVYIA